MSQDILVDLYNYSFQNWSCAPVILFKWFVHKVHMCYDYKFFCFVVSAGYHNGLFFFIYLLCMLFGFFMNDCEDFIV